MAEFGKVILEFADVDPDMCCCVKHVDFPAQGFHCTLGCKRKLCPAFWNRRSHSKLPKGIIDFLAGNIGQHWISQPCQTPQGFSVEALFKSVSGNPRQILVPEVAE